MVELGCAIMDRNEGTHCTFIDCRRLRASRSVASGRDMCDNQSHELVSWARRLVSLFEKRGVQKGKILISVSLLASSTRVFGRIFDMYQF